MASSVSTGTSVRPAALTGWRLLLTRPARMPYNWLVAAVLTANVVIAVLIVTDWAPTTLADPVTLLIILSGANLTVAVLIRQQYVINLLFRIATSASRSVPLAIRRHLAKVYHFGGVHVGSAVAAVIWFLAGSVALLLSAEFSIASKIVALALVVCLLGVLVPAPDSEA